MKLRIDIVKSFDVDGMPDNFWELDRSERQQLMIEAVNGTVLKSNDFIPDSNGDYTAIIADYWAYPGHNNIN